MKDEYHHLAVSYVLAIACVLTFAAAVASVVRADECRDALLVARVAVGLHPDSDCAP